MTIKVSKFEAYKGPDGKVYETKDQLERAVRRAVISEEIKSSFTGGEIWAEDVVNVVHNKWDLINAKVSGIMVDVED